MRLTSYDFGNLLYSSYYLAGLAANATRLGYDFRVSTVEPPLLRSLSPADRAFIHLFEFSGPKGEFAFCIDTRDQGYAADAAYDKTLLRGVAYYFKVNHNPAAVEAAPELRPFAERIHAARPFFPIRPPGALRYLPRPMTARRNPHAAMRRVKHLRDMPTLGWIRSLRRVEPDLDVVFVVAVWGKREHRHEDNFRFELARALREQRDLAAKVGLVPHGDVPRAYAPLVIPPASLRAYLRQQARARVAIYCRGLHGCLSFKLGQLLAMGRPIVGQTLLNNREQLMANAHFAEQFAFNDVDAIVARVRELLANAEERRTLSEGNRAAFDATFTPEAVISEMLLRMGVR